MPDCLAVIAIAIKEVYTGSLPLSQQFDLTSGTIHCLSNSRQGCLKRPVLIDFPQQ